jgi:hypothetical protein
MVILFKCKSLFKLKLECGEMGNRIVNKSFRRKLNQVLLHEKMENGVTINNNLSVDKIDQ